MSTLEREKTWSEIVETAKERIAIGATDVYLGDGARDDLDWSKCIGMEPGGSHRLDIYTSVWFHFEANGLKLRWSFDIEKREANGSNVYMIDTEGVLALLARLPKQVRADFIGYLKGCAAAIEKRATEQLGWVQQEFGTAAILANLSRSLPGER